MFTIAICDDNKQDCSDLCNMVEQYFFGKQKIELHSFQSGEVLYQFMKNHNVHLVIMDIILDNQSGIDIVKQLKYIAPDCKIIFVSINPEYFQDVYYVDHLQFLVKPIERKRLDFALGKAVALCEKEYVCLKIQGAVQRILAESILYFEVSGHNTTIHLNDETEQVCYISLKEIERRLNQTIFLRCHRSFIVNMKHVSRYERSSLQLDDKHMVSIGKKYEKDVRQKLMSYWKDVI